MVLRWTELHIVGGIKITLLDSFYMNVYFFNE